VCVWLDWTRVLFSSALALSASAYAVDQVNLVPAGVPMPTGRDVTAGRELDAIVGRRDAARNVQPTWSTTRPDAPLE
jgi:hypothetical protein